MSNVFMIAPMAKFAGSAPTDWGGVEYMFEDYRAVNALAGQPCVDKLTARLTEMGYVPGEDLVALTGRVAVVAMLVLAASSLSDTGMVRCLVFDARDGGSYVEKTVSPSKAST